MNPYNVVNPYELRNNRIKSREYHEAVDSEVGKLFQESALAKAKMVICEARQWWDSYGNPYLTMRVRFVDNEGISFWLESGRVDGGSGEYYKQVLFDLLQKHDLAPKTGLYYVSGAEADYSHFIDDTRDNRDKYHFTMAEVARKKDLHL